MARGLVERPRWTGRYHVTLHPKTGAQVLCIATRTVQAVCDHVIGQCYVFDHDQVVHAREYALVEIDWVTG